MTNRTDTAQERVENKSMDESIASFAMLVRLFVVHLFVVIDLSMLYVFASETTEDGKTRTTVFILYRVSIFVFVSSRAYV
jgi:hypothetical protein